MFNRELSAKIGMKRIEGCAKLINIDAVFRAKEKAKEQVTAPRRDVFAKGDVPDQKRILQRLEKAGSVGFGR